MKKTTFSLLLLSGAMQVQAQQPNIIVFLVDDMGLMDTSVPFIADQEGNTSIQPLNEWYHTPNMERMASQGTRFTTFYAQSVSSPSRTSIMTGQNSARHRTTNWIHPEWNNRDQFGPLEWNWEGIKKDNHIFPNLLKTAGYKTIHVGKAHFGSKGSEGEFPENIGFDVNIGGASIGQPGSYYGEYGYGWIKGDKIRAVPNLEKYHGSSTFLSDALTFEAIKEMEKAVAQGKPFYLNMAHYAVHAPFDTDKRFIKNYQGKGKSQEAQAFATLIEGMDYSLGMILDKLEEMGIAENTLIIFLGDNGGDAPLGGAADYGSSAPLKGKKGSEYEGGVRVPFIMAWGKPNSENPVQKRFPIAVNEVQTQIATVMDIYPTVLDAAQVNPPKDYILDGSSLRKLAQGKKDRKHRDDFLAHFPHAHRGSYFTTYRKGDWKLIYYYNPQNPDKPGYKLFNLAEDPYETTDLAGTEKKQLKKMCQLMVKRLEKENALYPIDSNQNPIAPVIPE